MLEFLLGLLKQRGPDQDPDQDPNHSKDTARRRLQLVLMHDRLDLAPDKMEAMEAGNLAGGVPLHGGGRRLPSSSRSAGGTSSWCWCPTSRSKSWTAWPPSPDAPGRLTSLLAASPLSAFAHVDQGQRQQGNHLTSAALFLSRRAWSVLAG